MLLLLYAGGRSKAGGRLPQWNNRPLLPSLTCPPLTLAAAAAAAASHGCMQGGGGAAAGLSCA